MPAVNDRPMDTQTMRAILVDAHQAALDAVSGRPAVARYLRSVSGEQRPTHAAAIGKAAADMMAGALDVLGDQLRDALVITKHGHSTGLAEYLGTIRVIESAHPVPDASCLQAGEALWRFVHDAPKDARLLLMMSGGASALAEHLAVGLDARFLARVNDWLLASGMSIGPMNRVRKRISRIKGGRLAFVVNDRETLSLMISDVPNDDPKVIGSGPLALHTLADIGVSDLALPDWLASATADPPPLAPAAAFDCIHSQLVAHPAMARAAAEDSLRAQGVAVRRHDELLEGDAAATGVQLVQIAQQAPGIVHLWSSETTIKLPARPGRGGRCQSLALSAALALDACGDAVVLAAGTDGTDGPGLDAGAVVDAHSVARGRHTGRDPVNDLDAADAGSFLDASDDLLCTGPTGTNVMDLLMAWSAPHV